MRYEPCPACGRPTAVSKRHATMREHTRTYYTDGLAVTVRCRGSLSIHPEPPPAPPSEST